MHYSLGDDYTRHEAGSLDVTATGDDEVSLYLWDADTLASGHGTAFIDVALTRAEARALVADLLASLED